VLLVEGQGRALTPLAGWEAVDLAGAIRALQATVEPPLRCAACAGSNVEEWEGRPIRESEAFDAFVAAGFGRGRAAAVVGRPPRSALALTFGCERLASSPPARAGRGCLRRPWPLWLTIPLSSLGGLRGDRSVDRAVCRGRPQSGRGQAPGRRLCRLRPLRGRHRRRRRTGARILESRAQRGGKLAIVIDVDETALSKPPEPSSERLRLQSSPALAIFHGDRVAWAPGSDGSSGADQAGPGPRPPGPRSWRRRVLSHRTPGTSTRGDLKRILEPQDSSGPD